MERIMKKLSLIMAVFTVFASLSFAAPAEYKTVNQNNQEVSLSQYRGSYVILVFWASWCPPCRMELPHIQKLYEKYGENKEGIVFLGMNEEARDEVKYYLDKNNLTFPTLVGHQDIFPIRAYPTLVILDKKGNTMDHAIGAIPESMLDKYIQMKLLNK